MESAGGGGGVKPLNYILRERVYKIIPVYVLRVPV